MTLDNVKSTLKPKFYRFLLWVLIVIAGSGYGLLGYSYFLSFFSSKYASGVMMAAYLIGIPFSGSATIAYFMYRGKEDSLFFKFLKIFLTVAITSAACIFLSMVFFNEGSICVLMFIGIIIIPIILGIGLGMWMARLCTDLKNKLMSVFLLFPFTIAPIEHRIPPQEVVHETKQSVFIEASAETVWKNIMNPENIRAEEIGDAWAYKIGAPYPVGASLTEEKIGGIRKSIWQRGVKFDEEITKIEKNKHIEWIYHFTDESFPPGSLDDHVKVGGTYFDLLNTSYTLRSEGSGTWLDISVKYRVTTHFNWYAAPWGHFFVNDTSKSLLNFYKKRSEA